MYYICKSIIDRYLIFDKITHHTLLNTYHRHILQYKRTGKSTMSFPGSYSINPSKSTLSSTAPTASLILDQKVSWHKHPRYFPPYR